MQTISETSVGATRPDRAEPSPADAVLHAMLTIGRHIRGPLRGDSLQPGQFWMLKRLAASEESVRMTELAASMGLDASTVSRHLTQMERAELIERTPDPADRRAQRVQATAAGREQLHASFERRRALLMQGLNGWDEADVTEFGRLLEQFVATIDSKNHDTKNNDKTQELEHA